MDDWWSRLPLRRCPTSFRTYAVLKDHILKAGIHCIKTFNVCNLILKIFEAGLLQAATFEACNMLLTSHQTGTVRWWCWPTTSAASVLQIGTSTEARPSRSRCPCCGSASFTEEICQFTAQLLRRPRQNQSDGVLWTMQLQWHHCLRRQPGSHQVCLHSHGRISQSFTRMSLPRYRCTYSWSTPAPPSKRLRY